MKNNFFKNFFNKRKSNYGLKGGIDTVTPSYISGWIYMSDCKFDEIRLLIGENLVAKANINRYRKDVCEFLNEEGCFGFQLTLEDLIPLNCIDLKPKIIAKTPDRLGIQPAVDAEIEPLFEATANAELESD